MPTGNRPSMFAEYGCLMTLAVFAFFSILILSRSMFAQDAAGTQPASSAPQSGAYDATRFAGEQRRLGSAIEKNSGDAKGIEAIQKALPPSWKIDTSEAHYEFSSEPLRELLACIKCDAAARKSRFARAKSWTDAIALQLDGYAAHGGFSAPDARATLEQILKRREFGAVLALHPLDKAQANYDLARACHAAGDAKCAMDAVLAALEIAPDFRPAQKLLLELNGQ